MSDSAFLWAGPAAIGRRGPAWKPRRWWFRVVVLTGTAAVVVAARGATVNNRTSATATTTTAGSSTVYRWGVVGNRGKIASLQLQRPTAVAEISGNVVKIATSNSDGYALADSGQGYGWGANNYGDLGNGTTASEAGHTMGRRSPSL
ncbi:MAG: hypothetical protein M0020_10385 [Actinomycetota bacterium]|nr:hypothetical protein [Actinomycetota bacterium]